MEVEESPLQQSELDAMRTEIERCHKEMQKIARHDREIKMVWAHHAHMQNYASTLEVENVELKIENEVLKDMVERMRQQRNVRRAIFLDTPEESRTLYKRQKTEHTRDEESDSDGDSEDGWRKRKNERDGDSDARKRHKRLHLLSEQTKKRPSAWGASFDSVHMDDDAMCNHCRKVSAEYKTEHFFCGTKCYTAFYNKM